MAVRLRESVLGQADFRPRFPLVSSPGARFFEYLVGDGVGLGRGEQRQGQGQGRGRGHLYLQWIDEQTTSPTHGLVVDTRNISSGFLSALIDTSGGSDDGFVPTRVNAVVQAWVHYGLCQVAKLARWLAASDGDSAKLQLAELLEAKAARMRKAFSELMVRAVQIPPSTGDDADDAAAEALAVCDGLCDPLEQAGPSDKSSDSSGGSVRGIRPLQLRNTNASHTALHSSFYALALGLLGDSPEQQRGILRYLQHRLETSAVGFPGGAYPIQFFLKALYHVTADQATQSTAAQLALDVLTTPASKLHGWLSMLDTYNATTTMECWSEDELPNLTFSHIWSASPSFATSCSSGANLA